MSEVLDILRSYETCLDNGSNVIETDCGNIDKLVKELELLSPKPILIVRMPDIPMEQTRATQSQVQQKMDDYHVFIVNSPNLKEPEFQVFYEKDFNEVRYEELKQIVKDSMINMMNNES